jgi:hypothetical protein
LRLQSRGEVELVCTHALKKVFCPYNRLAALTITRLIEIRVSAHDASIRECEAGAELSEAERYAMMSQLGRIVTSAISTVSPRAAASDSQ